MADIEKVIKGLEVCANCDRGFFCGDCPYESTDEKECIEFLTRDALELLKSQPQIVRCLDCKYVECEGVEGFLVCDLSGFSHSPEFFCADGEPKQQK